MRRAIILAFLVTAIVSMAIACGRRQTAPVSPTAATPGTSDDFWRATWGGGNYLLTIDEGGVGGTRVYQRGSPYAGVYDPNPHIVFLGSPDSTSGPDAQSVPGMILRHVWVSAQPRPAYANR